MNPVPPWAPNVHPLLVHFPLALLVAAAGVDVAAWILRRNRLLRQSATLLYVLGTAAAVAAYFAGREASAVIRLPGMAQAVLKDHWEWAFRTVWFFGTTTVARLVLLARREPHPAVVAGLALAGLLGVGLLIETGDRGGRLVYQYGVGVSPE